jgi:hypothetical protein
MKFIYSIDVNASPERIWTVWTDVERWPEWTASMRRLEVLGGGPLGSGSRVRIEQPRLPPAVWRVTAFEPAREFTWVAGAPLLTTVASHQIEPRPAGGSIVTMTLEQKGPLWWPFGWLTKGLTRRYVEMERDGLKRRAEGVLN